MEATSIGFDNSPTDQSDQNKSVGNPHSNYEFLQENLYNIPYPDNKFPNLQTPTTKFLDPNDLEIPPLPPEFSKSQLDTCAQCDKKSIEESVHESSSTLSPANIPLPQNLSPQPNSPLPISDIHADNDFSGVENHAADADQEVENYADLNRYSPSKMDSDEENQYYITAKPKVLGKEQAKKRLMAFSLSKQPSSSVKKQSKLVPPSPKNIKEKPPNPNKGSGVQDQFRVTISEIEEEKRKMLQNMPNYLLLEMSDLAKSTHPIITSSLKLLEKYKSESKSKETSQKNCTEEKIELNESANESKNSLVKEKQRSRTPSRGYRRSRSRSRDRNQCRKKANSSRSRRRSRSKSRSPGNKSKEKYSRQEKKKSSISSKTKESHKDWKSFKASGFSGVSEIWETLTQHEENEKEKPKDNWCLSPINDRWEYKPIFSYLKDEPKLMRSFKAKSANSRSDAPALYLEKNIKFTKTKPTLIWSENPSNGTEFYMSRRHFLDNCDSATAAIVRKIIDSKDHPNEIEAAEPLKIRTWYSSEDFLRSKISNLFDEFDLGLSQSFEKSSSRPEPSLVQPNSFSESLKKRNNRDVEMSKGENSRERRISLVNDSYLSDEENELNKLKEMVVGDVKVQMNLDLNCVKVRSKWDSDYEGENGEKETVRHKQMEADGIEAEKSVRGKNNNLLNVRGNVEGVNSSSMQHAIKEEEPNDKLKGETQMRDVAESKMENLASEYEEFLKMVSFDSNPAVLDQENNLERNLKNEKTETEKSPVKKSGLEITDWDKESDHEDKVVRKGSYYKGDSDKESAMLSGEKVSLKKKKRKVSSSSSRKTEKMTKKEKSGKKSVQNKKKKRSSSSSSVSSSSGATDSESDSESDSDDGRSRKKKKARKTKKKYKRQSSSSESDSDDSESKSDDSKSKKKKEKKRKEKKKRRSESSSESEDEEQTSLLKHLDFKKHLIIKKIEEIDSIGEKGGRKKLKKEAKIEKKEKKSSGDLCLFEKYSKSGKKKKTERKEEKKKKKIESKKSDSSDMDDAGEKSKKKSKAEGKKRKAATESSDSDSCSDLHRSKPEKYKGIKTPKSEKKNKKLKKMRKKSYSSSDSESRSSSSAGGNKSKAKVLKNKMEDEKTRRGWQDEFMIAGDFKSDRGRLEFGVDDLDWKKETKEPGANDVKEKIKGIDDWEESSPSQKSVPECKSRESWDDEMSPPAKPSKNVKNLDARGFDADLARKTAANESAKIILSSSSDLKNSLQDFSFNENSFCGFGQELSRDFFFTEQSYSNPAVAGEMKNGEGFSIESRPFHSIAKGGGESKPDRSEIYSPGHTSDTEASDVEDKKIKEEIYDPLKSDSDTSLEPDVEPGKASSETSFALDNKISSEKNEAAYENYGVLEGAKTEGSLSGSIAFSVAPQKTQNFTSVDFSPSKIAASFMDSNSDRSLTKKQVISVKSQPKLQSKAASVFQDDSTEDEIEDSAEKTKTIPFAKTKTEDVCEEIADKNKSKSAERKESSNEKEDRKSRKREESRERHEDGDHKRRRSSSRERRNSSRWSRDKASSPVKGKRSESPEMAVKTEIKEKKREIRSDSFEIEPLKSATEYEDLEEAVQPIPVFTGLGTTLEQPAWTRSHFPNYTSTELSDVMGVPIDPSEAFDIYPSEDSKYGNRNFEKMSSERVDDSTDKSGSDKSGSRTEKKRKEKRRSRSRSSSPRRRRRSKSPEKRRSSRNRSPRRRSKSPKRRDRSSYSPRRKSPRRKSPSRRHRSSRSPERRRKSRSRSPRKRRSSPGRRSYSISPRKHRSPKRRDSPRRKSSPSRAYSPRKSLSPRRDGRFSHPYLNNYHNRIPVIGGPNEGLDSELSPSVVGGSPMGFSRHESNLDESHANVFYNREYGGEFGNLNYPEEMGANNLITVKNHDLEKGHSPERPSLDQRIELELGVPINGQGDQYQKGRFQDVRFQNSYENAAAGTDNFYSNSDYNSQYYNGEQITQPGYGSFHQYNSNPQGSMLQVGNIVEVVPALQHSHSSSAPSKNSGHQIMQVGNVLQVVPSQKTSQGSPMSFHGVQSYGPSSNASPVPALKTQKATAVVAPSSIVPQPNPEAMINPLIKAIQLEREKRKKEKEKRRAEREARRKARQLRREAKLMSVNEKLKKSVQNEGLMLGQEVEDDELLEGADLPSPPIPVEIITVSSPSALPPAGKGILITAGFMPKPPSEKKEVKFADGVLPGEGTSTEGEEDVATPPPKPKLPKEKRYKKKKAKVKKKVKVEIIRKIIEQTEEEEEEDDLSPPPPPPGDPPPIYFARFPFAGDAQFPVYQTPTTAPALNTVQYSAATF